MRNNLCTYQPRRSYFPTFRASSLYNDFFDDFFNFETPLANKVMKTNIINQENDYLLEAELPGLKKEDINIDIKDNILTISVNQNTEKEIVEENYVRKERTNVYNTRSFNVENIVTENIDAKYEDGVLKLTLPKREEQKEEVKKIEVK